MNVIEDGDGALWARARDGDASAFGVLFERHGRTIYNYCFRRTADWAVAEDLMSVVFLVAWRKRGRVELHQDSALPWLYGVAANVLRDHARSRRRHAAALRRLPAGVPDAEPAEIVAGRVDDERRMGEVLDGVARLTRPQRDVLSLCAWEGLTYEEAAVALGVPVGTVRSRLARARQSLASASGELDPTHGHERADQLIGTRRAEPRPGGGRGR